VAKLTRRYHLPSAVRRTSIRIEPEAARALVDAGAVVIDVRRKDDAAPSPEGSSRIPPDEIPAALSFLPRHSPIVLACT
jgi:rhodanese-related sulfurtransferase